MPTSREHSRAKSGLTILDIRLFEKVSEQMQSLRDDFAELSKKHPNDPLNVLKVGFVNEKLAEANRLLTGQHKPFATFEKFDPDALPTNSDVQLVLSQYLSCLEGWRSAHVVKSVYDWIWDTSETRLVTDEPTRSREKSL
jgi:hypothetical protein